MTKNLALTGYEKGYLTAYYHTAILDNLTGYHDDEWYGVDVDGRMFDLNVWVDDITYELICTVYECDWINDNYQTNTEYSWTLAKGDKI
jgi:hypothetical protein|tara:strand:+ start:66 stop:332 length:267 start_codon:yes stop_codon:yes gene_type:complete